MLSLDQLQMFKNAVEKGSFSAAGRALGKGTSTVSEAVSKLEVYLGVSLFERGARQAELTAEGERLYAQSLVLFKQVDHIEHSAAASFSQVESKLSIGIGHQLPGSYFEEAIARVAREYPSTQLRISRGNPEELLAGLKQQRYNLLLMASAGRYSTEYDFIGLNPLQMCFVCASDSAFAETERVEQQALYSTRQIVSSALLSNPVLAEFIVYSPEVWEVSSLDDVVRLVEQDLGWGCLPKELVAEREQIGGMVRFSSELTKQDVEIPVDLVSLVGESAGPVQQLLMNSLQAPA